MIKELNEVFFGELMNEDLKQRVIQYVKNKYNIDIKCSFNFEERKIEVS